MDVLIPDRSTTAGQEMARALEAGGHRVHACVHVDGALPCASLAGRACPLDGAPVDVVVEAASGPRRGELLGDGAVCAVRRHIPLVLAGAGDDHPLAPWAAGHVGSDVRAAVAAVLGHPLPGHTAAARKALLHELRHQGSDSETASVEVFRRPGRLLVELWTDSSMSRTQAERLATHVAQAVRGYDRWAPKLDVTVRTSAPEPVGAGR